MLLRIFYCIIVTLFPLLLWWRFNFYNKNDGPPILNLGHGCETALYAGDDSILCQLTRAEFLAIFVEMKQRPVSLKVLEAQRIILCGKPEFTMYDRKLLAENRACYYIHKERLLYRQEQDIKALFKKKPEWLFTTVVKRALLGLFISFLLLFSKRIPTQFSLDDKKILLDFMIGFYTLVAAVYGIAIMFYIKPDQDNPYFWALVLEIFGTSIVGISKFFGDALRRILQLALF